jgi:hypothetical protein
MAASGAVGFVSILITRVFLTDNPPIAQMYPDTFCIPPTLGRVEEKIHSRSADGNRSGRPMTRSAPRTIVMRLAALLVIRSSVLFASGRLCLAPRMREGSPIIAQGKASEATGLGKTKKMTKKIRARRAGLRASSNFTVQQKPQLRRIFVWVAIAGSMRRVARGKLTGREVCV